MKRTSGGMATSTNKTAAFGSLVYADKPQTFDHLEDNIRRVIADIRLQMLEKVIENWTSRLDYIRASRGSPMPEIIFKIEVSEGSVENDERSGRPQTSHTAENIEKFSEVYSFRKTGAAVAGPATTAPVKYRIVACLVTSLSPVPLKIRRVRPRCTLNLSKAETSSRWCGVVVRRGDASSGVVHVT
ncbi:uncharacterized protein TNCV_3973441 [Trichonephila clavipes]|nr:uncharacterized protein TNCV_3973441 [Trichonephila clavipes]